MNVTASSQELARSYEALRAQAVGELAAVTPRGLAVLRRAGLVTWMRACPPGAPAARREPPGAGHGTALGGVSGELVSVLTEMALGAGRRWRGAS